MKIIVEENNEISKDKIIIKCNEENSFINKIKEYVENLSDLNISFYKHNQEYF